MDDFRRAATAMLDRDGDDPADKVRENRQARRRSEREWRRMLRVGAPLDAAGFRRWLDENCGGEK